MKIYSTPFLSKVTCLAFSSFFLFVWFHLHKMHTLTNENVFVLAFFLFICFVLLLYMDSHSIEFGPDSVSYIWIGKKKTLYYHDIYKIEVTYYHQNIRTIAPVLHIIGEMNEIEIPFGLFERRFDEIHHMIRKKVFLRPKKQ